MVQCRHHTLRHEEIGIMNDIFRLLDLIASPVFVYAILTMSASSAIVYLVLVGRAGIETLFAMLFIVNLTATIVERGVESG